jgi:hypothetical protein
VQRSVCFVRISFVIKYSDLGSFTRFLCLVFIFLTGSEVVEEIVDVTTAQGVFHFLHVIIQFPQRVINCSISGQRI